MARLRISDSGFGIADLRLQNVDWKLRLLGSLYSYKDQENAVEAHMKAGQGCPDNFLRREKNQGSKQRTPGRAWLEKQAHEYGGEGILETESL